VYRRRTCNHTQEGQEALPTGGGIRPHQSIGDAGVGPFSEGDNGGAGTILKRGGAEWQNRLGLIRNLALVVAMAIVGYCLANPPLNLSIYGSSVSRIAPDDPTRCDTKVECRAPALMRRTGMGKYPDGLRRESIDLGVFHVGLAPGNGFPHREHTASAGISVAGGIA
jgi:hypothetical protein